MKIKVMLRIVIITAGALLMGVGIYSGELTAILRKAVIICFECIGIG